MRIAFYCPNKPLDHPHPSGDRAIARSLHIMLNRLGHDCREVVRFRSRWFWKTHGGWMDAFAASFRALSHSRTFKPHLWLTYHTYYKSPDVIGPWVSRLHGIPYVLFQPIYGTRRRKHSSTRIGFHLNRLALKKCDHAFTNNLNDIEALNRILPAGRISYIPPGIFPEEFRRDVEAGKQVRSLYRVPDETPLILTAARFRPGIKYKSLAYLFRSLALLAKKNLSFLLLAVGSGPLEREIREMGREFLGERILFAGQVPRETMPSYYSAADIFAFPGVDETLGMVFLEAQACGLPVVALDAAGVPQVVLDGETGLLVPADGGPSMAHAVETLIHSPDMREELGRNGISYVWEQRNLHINYTLLAARLASMA